MTCTIAYETELGIEWGSDTCSSNGFTKQTINSPKYFTKHGVTIGFAGSWRDAQLIEKFCTFKKHKKKMSNDEYLIKIVVEEIKSVLTKHSSVVVSGSQHSTDSNLIIGYKGVIYVMYSDFCLLKEDSDYAVIGSGAYHAEAALDAFNMSSEQFSTRGKIHKALQIASKYIASVTEPFHIQFVEA